MLYFNCAQTFLLDKSAVKNASEVAITRVDLYFRAKPPATENKSGIENPGVEIKIVPTLNGVPVINQMGAYRPTEPTEHGAKFAFYSGGQTSRVEYDQVLPSTNATIPTQFLFDEPIFVKTDLEYAIIIKYDGGENFVLWKNVNGETLVGSNTVSTGPTGRFSGSYFHFIDNPNQDPLLSSASYGYSNSTLGSDQVNLPSLIYTSGVTGSEGLDNKYLQANWSPIPDTNVKFRLFVARYMINGVPVVSLTSVTENTSLTTSMNRTSIHGLNTDISNNVIRLNAPVQTNEYVIFQAKNSVKDDLMYGEPFYQDGPAYPGGTATPLTMECFPTVSGSNTSHSSLLVQANGSYVYPNGATFNESGGFNTLFNLGDIIVLKDGANVFTVQIDDITTNTELVINPPFEENIAAAQMFITPIGFLNDMSRNLLFGSMKDIVTLYNSQANSTVRFVSHSIANTTINDGGNGYSNSDYIRIACFEDIDYAVKGNYSAFANVVTNGNGTITAVYFSNVGAGFSNVSHIAGANIEILQSANGVSSNDSSNGDSANISFTVGSKLKSAFTTTTLANAEIVNLEVMRMKPEITVNNPLGSGFSIRHRTLYHSVPDSNTVLGKAYYVDTPAETANTDTYSKIFKSHTLNVPDVNKTPVLTSRSNEYVIRFANGSVNNSNTWGSVFSNTALFIFDISSNNDYQAIYFDPEIVNSHYGKYIINGDYSDEHTNYGKAFAKHVATKINLAQNHTSEDVLVYLTAYRPANTSIKVYARIKNKFDEQAFDDLDWTELEIIDGNNIFSSKDDSNDYIELTYNLRAYPNTDFTLDGSVTLTQGNLNVTGLTTTFTPGTTINNGGSGYANGDVVSFTPPNTQYVTATGIFADKRQVPAKFTVGTDGSGVITSLTIVDQGYGWANQANVVTFTVANSTGGATGGVSANLYFRAGLQANDMVKIYSPYSDFANVNYTITIVDSVTNATHFTAKRTVGTVAANSVGNVSINTTSATVDGVGTDFTTLDAGDFIIIWANSSVYGTYEVSSVTDANTLVLTTNGTFTNTATKYALVTPDAFLNTSVSQTNLKIDRIAYPHQAFNFVGNDNVSRYYNSSLIEFDGYDTAQIKVVLLADNEVKVPKVDSIRGVLVTA